MEVDFDDIRDEEAFWLYFLAVSFPLAFDEGDEMTLGEFIEENCECDSEWVDEFVGFDEETFDEEDGHSDDPASVAVQTSGGEYVIQYHPGDVVYLKDGKQIASTGAHYDLHKLSFAKFVQYAEELGDPEKALLLLPIVFIGEDDADKAAEYIGGLMEELPLEEEDCELITPMIVQGLIKT